MHSKIQLNHQNTSQVTLNFKLPCELTDSHLWKSAALIRENDDVKQTLIWNSRNRWVYDNQCVWQLAPHPALQH